MKSDIFSLKNKTTIVTGGAGYLGLAITEGLLEQGSEVYIVSKSKNNLEKAHKKLKDKGFEKLKTLKIDVQSLDSIKKGFQKIKKDSGKIDVLINNAYFGNDGKFENKTEREWNLGIEGTINSVFRTSKIILPIMKKQKAGSIINVASIYGTVSPDPSIYGNSDLNSPPEYGAGKAAIIQFTKYTAVKFAQYGIRVNSISPGPFPNEKIQKNKKFIKNLTNKIPMKRIGTPDELKGVTVFLASNASSFVTGENIHIDGGWTSW